MSDLDPTSPEPTAHDEKKRRGQRNAAIALMLFLFVIIIYAVTILRIGGNVADRAF